MGTRKPQTDDAEKLPRAGSHTVKKEDPIL